MDNVISTSLGDFSKNKFNALLNVRNAALTAIRSALTKEGYTEVSTSSLVNIAGSCENPYASFSLNYYGREAHLSQSAQLQLEALVIRLKRGVFTVNNSFREENYDDPDTKGRRLSEFTLIEPEKPYPNTDPNKNLKALIHDEERIIKSALKEIIKTSSKNIKVLGGQVDYLKSIPKQKFNVITYNEALQLLNRKAKRKKYKFGDDLNITEERKILEHFKNIPTFITHFPTKLKFFNMKRTEDGQRTYSVDLLTPRLGETIGGAIREEDGEKIKEYLLSSKIATYIRDHSGDPLEPFAEYLKLFEQEDATVRGGFGIGFERFVGFLLHSNDILETIAYRSMQPKQWKPKTSGRK